jgi:hypothetical protein
MEISWVQREVGRPLGRVPTQLMGVVNHGLLILLVAIITLSNNEFRFLFCLVSQNLTDFKKNEDFSALDYTVKNETARSNFEIAV